MKILNKCIAVGAMAAAVVLGDVKLGKAAPIVVDFEGLFNPIRDINQYTNLEYEGLTLEGEWLQVNYDNSFYPGRSGLSRVSRYDPNSRLLFNQEVTFLGGYLYSGYGDYSFQGFKGDTLLYTSASVSEDTGAFIDVIWEGIDSIKINGRYGDYSVIDDITYSINNAYNVDISAVPLPAGVWLFGSALAGLGYISRRRKKTSEQTAVAA